MTHVEAFKYQEQYHILGYHINDILEENGGEVTEEVEALEAERQELIRILVEGGRAETLGWMLTNKMSEIDNLKAEADYHTRKLRAAEKDAEAFKRYIRRFMDSIDQNVMKVDGYTFKQNDRTEYKPDNKAIKEKFNAIVREALEKAGVPKDVTFTLSGSVTGVKEMEEIPEYWTVEQDKTVTFLRPRKTKEQSNQ